MTIKFGYSQLLGIPTFYHDCSSIASLWIKIMWLWTHLGWLRHSKSQFESVLILWGQF